MKLRHTLFLFCAVVALTAITDAQENPPAHGHPLPRIQFVFDHPDMPVAHYEIELSSDGAAHYESKSRGQEKGTFEEGLSRDFVVSAKTRDRIFALAKSANDLDGAFDFTKHKIAFTGNKTITLADSQGIHTAKLVWSENQQVMALVELFQGISGTLEEEPVLQRLRKFDRLGLNAELAKMEKLAESGWLRELNLISGVLKEIASDQQIMGLARKRAERLLKLAAPGSNET